MSALLLTFGSLSCVLASVTSPPQMQGPPAHVLEGGDGVVVDQGVQGAVQVGQSDGHVEHCVQVLHIFTDLLLSACDLSAVEPDKQHRDVIGEEANHKDHHHHHDEP